VTSTNSDINRVNSGSILAVNGSDVYVVGYYISSNPNADAVACYWKNGVINYITDGTHCADATCVYVNGSDVYIAYFEGDNGNTVTKVLKNGTLIHTVNGLEQAGPCT
jgi:hypothetical protein